MNIEDIKRANAAAGFQFFSADTMRFFRSRVERMVYEGPGGIYFLTSEQFVLSSGIPSPRAWTVRRFDPATGRAETAAEFGVMSLPDAMQAAKRLAKGGAQ